MKYKLAIIPHTHWDREWYQTFQGFRHRLVKMMDKLLDVLDEEERFSCFTLDGQTIVIEDYLEIRPEKEEKIRKFVKEGKILIGPWYILPDEFLVSGESLVRNLLFGHRIAKNFGKVMKIGYLPDQFGHSIAIPKILKGSNIDCAVIWRGVGEEINNTEFIWESDDGSKVLTIYMPHGYCNAVNLPYEEEKLLNKLKSIAESLTSYATTPYLLLMNGCDHQEAQGKLPDVLEKIKDKLPHHYEITNLENLKEKILESVNLDKLTKYKGEFRSHKRAFILPGTLSTRVNLKKSADELEILLSNFVEPLSAFAHLEGFSYPESYLNLAWKYLLQNQPHDSICGCSIDEVHREMEVRFSSSKQIAENIMSDVLEYILSKIENKIINSEFRIVVFNLTESKRTDVIELQFFGKNYAIFDRNGRELISEKDGEKIKFLAKDVPGFGFKTFYLKEIKESKKSPKTDLIAKNNSLENKYFKITLNKDGSINIFDKINKVYFKNCCQFEEGGDAGDEYNYSPPLKDILIKKPFYVENKIIEKSAVKITMEILQKYYFPESLTHLNRKTRKRNKKLCIIKNRISLLSSVPRIEFETEIENNVKDHRLRVLFPIPWRADKSFALNHFGIIERETILPTYTDDYPETPIGCYPNLGFVLVKNKNYSVSLSNIGLKEYEILEQKIIALTLLRGIGWFSKGDLITRKGNAGPEIETPDAQLLGKNILKYSFSGGKDFLPVLQSYSFRQKMIAKISHLIKNDNCTLPEELSFLEIQPEGIIVSAVKKSEEGDGIIVRVFNTKEEELKGILKIYKNFKNVSLVNLLEEKIKDIELKDGKINFSIKGGEMLTFKFIND